MAKKTPKKTVKKVVAKKTAAPKKTREAAPSPIEKICEDILKKLQSRSMNPGLQADIQWCLGSYRYDKNPSGLYIMAEKALLLFKSIAAQNDEKVVPAKFISDIESALKSR